MKLFIVFVLVCSINIIKCAPADSSLDAVLDNVGAVVKYGVIPPAQPFIDRPNELENIKILHLDRKFTVITGPRGVGKTELARKYAEGYDGSILCINTSSITQMVEDFKSIYSTNVDSVDSKKITTIIRGVFEHFKSKKTLYIFDGADSDNVLLKQLNNYIKQDDKSLVLVTSRNTNWNALYSSVPLDVFNEEDSVKYLKIVFKDLDIPKDDEKCKSLAKELANLPLALHKSAEYIIKQNTKQKYTIDDFIYQLQHGGFPTLPPPPPPQDIVLEEDWKDKIAQETERVGEQISSGASEAWEKVSSGATHVGSQISNRAHEAGQSISRAAENVGREVSRVFSGWGK